jgi:single-stranded-DNA-specific exonuclease
VERIHRPTVLISLDAATGRGRGSARSIPRFHLYDAIHACAPTLERYGGHRQAAGLEVLTSRIDEFAEAFNRHAASALEPDDWKPRVHVDAVVELREVTPALHRLLRHFGPFGMGNSAPTFMTRSVTLARPVRVVGENHAKLLLAAGDARLDAIAFGMADRMRELEGAPFDLLFQVQDDRRTGGIQARVVDARAAT